MRTTLPEKDQIINVITEKIEEVQKTKQNLKMYIQKHWESIYIHKMRIECYIKGIIQEHKKTKWKESFRTQNKVTCRETVIRKHLVISPITNKEANIWKEHSTQ